MLSVVFSFQTMLYSSFDVCPTAVWDFVVTTLAPSPSTNPVIVPGAVNGCPLYALVAPSVVKVTFLGLIVNVASAVNSTPLTVAFASIV